MLKIKETEFSQLEKGNLIAIQGSVELVTDVLEHTFYSASILMESNNKDEPLRKSSHWVGSLDEDEYMYVFKSYDELVSCLKKELNLLIEFYIP